MNTRKLVSELLLEDTVTEDPNKVQFGYGKYKLELDLDHTETKQVNQEYFAVDPDGNILETVSGQYGARLIKQYKSASGAAKYTKMPPSAEVGDTVGYVGVVTEVKLIPIVKIK